MGERRTFKTKKVLSGVQTSYRAWKEWDEGDVIIGTLRGTSPNRKNKTKVDWIMEVEDAFFSDKSAQKKVLPDKKGGPKKTITLNGAGQLDKGMQQIEVGDMVQITYNGTKTMEGGEFEGQEAHLHEVVMVEEDDGSETESDDSDDSDDDDEDIL